MNEKDRERNEEDVSGRWMKEADLFSSSSFLFFCERACESIDDKLNVGRGGGR